MRKGVYPYEYMDSPKRLKEIAIPPKEAFYSKLSISVMRIMPMLRKYGNNLT